MSDRIFLPALLILVVVLGATTAPGGPGMAQSLDSFIQSYEQAPGPGERTHAFYRFSDAFRRGQVTLKEGEDEKLALFLVGVMLNTGAGHQWLPASNMLQKHPHAVVAGELLECLENDPEGTNQTSARARRILAALGDERVLPYLEARIEKGEARDLNEVVSLLGEIGSPGCLPLLESLRDDPDLEERFAAGLLEARRANGLDTNPRHALESSQREAQRLREAAQLAIRRIRWVRQAGLHCGFPLHDSALAELDRRGFVIMPQPANEMFQWYSEEYPFVTTDFVYHTYMILVRAAYDTIEKTWLEDRLARFCAGMARACDGRDAAIFAIAAHALGVLDSPEFFVARELREDVLQELRLMASGAGPALSPLLERPVDYAEFQARGRFSREREGTLRALEWLGMAVLRSAREGELRRAVAVTRALYEDDELAAIWREIDEVMSVLGGRRDDPGYGQYLGLAQEITGRRGPAALQEVLEDRAVFHRFKTAVCAWPPPRIHLAVAPGRDQEAGLRLLAPRYAADAHHFQQLLADGLWPLSGLHVVADGLGSRRARDHLAVGSRRPGVSWPAEGEPGPSILDGYLEIFRTLFADAPAGEGVFATEAWQDKLVNTALGAWAETRHAAAPYVKEAHIYMGESEMTDRLHGFVEPYPRFFRALERRAGRLDALLRDLGVYEITRQRQTGGQARLDSLVARRKERQGRRERNTRAEMQREYQAKLDAQVLDENRLAEFRAILARLAELAEKGRSGQPQTPDDGVFLKNLAGRMRRLSFNTSSMDVAEESMARVIDVAREYQSGQVLWAGVGRALPIYVAVPDGDRRVVCRGAVYSYHEGTLGVSQLLDDQLWARLSMDLDTPLGPPWLERTAGLIHHP